MASPDLPKDAEVIEQFRVKGISTRDGREFFSSEIRSRRSEAESELERLKGHRYTTGLHIESRVIALGEWAADA